MSDMRLADALLYQLQHRPVEIPLHGSRFLFLQYHNIQER
jgi:hypothetical protein